MGTLGTVIKWTAGTLVVGALTIGGLGLFMYPKMKELAQARGGEQGEAVRTLKAEAGRLVRTVSAPGDIEPRRKVSISARVSALITELPFRDGDVVQAGDVVVRLDDKDLRAALDRSEASMRSEQARFESARAEVINAVAEWERLQELLRTNDISKSEFDRAEARKRQAEANLNAAEHAIEVARASVTQARENLRYTEIVSPISGRVTLLNAEEGELVVTGTMNNAGTVILEIADLSEMLVRAQVDETDIAFVRPGQSVRVNINAYPNEMFEGTVQLVSLQSTYSQQDRAKIYETEVLLHLDDRSLYSGLTANVDIEIETLEGVLLVPSQAVHELRTDELPDELRTSPHVTQNKTFTWAVYVVEGGRAMARPVTIGPSDLTSTAIVGGIEPGDEVIVGPWKALQRLEHKMAVRIQQPLDEQTPGQTELAGEAAAADASEAQPAATPVKDASSS